MLKILKEKWAENEEALRKAISEISNVNGVSYEDLVKLTFSKIYDTVDAEAITKIDDGDYQGTLLFIMPFKTYQPSEGEYLMTYVGYGSCSGCDTLEGIKDYFYDEHRPSEEQTDDLLTLCRHIIMNTIKPYNDGWRNQEDFETVEFDG